MSGNILLLCVTWVLVIGGTQHLGVVHYSVCVTRQGAYTEKQLMRKMRTRKTSGKNRLLSNWVVASVPRDSSVSKESKRYIDISGHFPIVFQ